MLRRGQWACRLVFGLGKKWMGWPRVEVKFLFGVLPGPLVPGVNHWQGWAGERENCVLELASISSLCRDLIRKGGGQKQKSVLSSENSLMEKKKIKKNKNPEDQLRHWPWRNISFSFGKVSAKNNSQDLSSRAVLQRWYTQLLASFSPSTSKGPSDLSLLQSAAEVHGTTQHGQWIGCLSLAMISKEAFVLKNGTLK